MKVFIEPTDVLLFRDGRPFSAGEGHRARSIFPPTPNTIQGVIRSKILADRCGRYEQYRTGCIGCPEQNNCSIPDEIGTAPKNGQGSYGQMQIKGPLIAQYNQGKITRYFPIPSDVVQVKKIDPVQLSLLQPLHSSIVGYNDLNYPLLPLWPSVENPVEKLTGYWSDRDIINYLNEGKLPDPAQAKNPKLFEYESRLGIEIDNKTQTTQEGKLYQTEFIRCYQNIGLYVEIEGIKQLSDSADILTGLIGIGGENKVASYRILEDNTVSKYKDEFCRNFSQANGFKIYLATPTIFTGKNQEGWLPNWINPATLSGQYKNINVILKAVALGNYQTIGGWDVANNRQKPTRRAVSAGTVYYFTSTDPPEAIFDAFHEQNLADNPQEAQIGFGLSLVGKWWYCQMPFS